MKDEVGMRWWICIPFLSLAGCPASPRTAPDTVDTQTGVRPEVAASSRVTPTTCADFQGETATHWRVVDEPMQRQYLSEHVRGDTTPRRGCQLSIMFSQLIVVWFEASGQPAFKPLPSRWSPQPGSSDDSTEFLNKALPGQLPDTPPRAQDHRSDGEGNFLHRYLFDRPNGEFVLVISYAG